MRVYVNFFKAMKKSKHCRNLSSVDCRQPNLSPYSAVPSTLSLLIPALCYCSMAPRMNDSDVERHFKHGKRSRKKKVIFSTGPANKASPPHSSLLGFF